MKYIAPLWIQLPEHVSMLHSLILKYQILSQFSSLSISKKNSLHPDAPGAFYASEEQGA